MATRFLKSIFKKKRSPEISGQPPTAKPEETKSFRENQTNEGAFDTINRGNRSVPLKQITGSVGRYQDFDSHFRIKKHIPSERLENIKAAMRSGKRLPPIKLYQIKDDFYVLDGNHRVSAAKEFDLDTILADIVEFIPSKNTLENILYRQRSVFIENTGLSQVIDLVADPEREELPDHRRGAICLVGAVVKRGARVEQEAVGRIELILAAIVDL